MKPFKSILTFQKHFNTDEKCRAFLELQRWGGTPACPFCGSIHVTRLKDGKRFNCNEKGCRTKFSVTVKTVFENTKIPLTKWFLAMYILSNHSKGISSLQLANWLDVTQTTAWFLNHRIREMLTDNSGSLLSGMVEVDETFVGGKDKNRHQKKKKGKEGKTMVMGAVQRGGKVITKVIPDVSKESVQGFVVQTVEPTSDMVTDSAHAYKGISNKFNSHETVNHQAKEYVRGTIYTNTIEGFWSILKKQIIGIHHQVSPKHLQRYCNESAYRYNTRPLTQDVRFAEVLTRCEGRLKYQDLIAKK